MMIRLIAPSLIVLSLILPSVALAQQSTPPGECESKRCPEGQTMDTTTKTCVAVSA